MIVAHFTTATLASEFVRLLRIACHNLLIRAEQHIIAADLVRYWLSRFVGRLFVFRLFVFRKVAN